MVWSSSIFHWISSVSVRTQSIFDNSFILRVRIPYPLQWGRPSFHGSDAFAMMAATYVAIVEVYYCFSSHFWFAEGFSFLIDHLFLLNFFQWIRRQVPSSRLQDLAVQLISLPRCLAVALDGR